MKIINPFLENIHAYNGKLHEAYTTSIYNIVYDTFADNDYDNLLAGYQDPTKILERARSIVFDFDYGIINGTIENKYLGTLNLKDSFEEAFISKYLTDEIAYESFSLWKTKLRGKLLEIVPVLNLQFNMFKEIELADLRGGYKYTETIDNTHSDNNTVKDTTTDKNTRTLNTIRTTDTESESGAISSSFPVNEVEDMYDRNMTSINYADGGNVVKNLEQSQTKDTGTIKDEGSRNLIGDRKNNGEYETNRNAVREDRNLIDNILKIRKAFNTLITESLNKFEYLFLGIY